MDDRNITSANLAATMIVDEIFPNGFTLEMFSSDAAVVADSVTETETRQTVDGKLVAGYTPAPKVVNITLEPPSPSLPYFKDLVRACRTAMKPYKVHLVVTLPATGETFRFKNGYLTSFTPMPASNKTLQPMNFQFTFESLE